MIVPDKDEACGDTGVMDNMHPDCRAFVAYNLCNDDEMHVAFRQNYPPAAYGCCHRELRVFVEGNDTQWVCMVQMDKDAICLQWVKIDSF